MNAIGLVVNYLLDNNLCNDAEREYLKAIQKLHSSTAGEGWASSAPTAPLAP